MEDTSTNDCQCTKFQQGQDALPHHNLIKLLVKHGFQQDGYTWDEVVRTPRVLAEVSTTPLVAELVVATPLVIDTTATS